MFWETKLTELQKLGTITIELDDTEGRPPTWRATLVLPQPMFSLGGAGPTKAAAVCQLWSMLTERATPIDLGSRTVRWNGRWEDIEPPKPELPVVEESDAQAFDPAD